MPDSPFIPRDLSRYTAAGFDRGASRIREAAWVLAKWMFFQTAFPWPSRWRVFLLRCFGAKIGAGVVIRGGVNITFPWRFEAGDHVWIGEEVFILSLALVKLESSVCVSQRAFLCTGSHDYSLATFDLRTAPITLRRGAWVAAQAFVGPGVEIGEGSVLAAGSVATATIAPGILARGNPAVTVKHLA